MINDQNVTAIITGVAGILGVAIGSVIGVMQAWLTKLVSRKEKATYLALIVAPQLDIFIGRCLDIAYDDGTERGRPAGSNGHHQTTIAPPEFNPLGFEAEWQSIPKNLMFNIMMLAQAKGKIEAYLDGDFEGFYDPPDHKKYFLARRYAYTKLGLEATKLLTQLRKYVDMPPMIDGEEQAQKLKNIYSDLTVLRNRHKKSTSPITKS
ncbi:hypothetical protein [Alcaligenes faecalis]|uniref:hypothetical protein n=1 Tax=Alcaligenes faecalis TaxID=511 RepID=UPI0018EF07DB|nr:hypothetical protein [Alcaligenes faecalis]